MSWDEDRYKIAKIAANTTGHRWVYCIINDKEKSIDITYLPVALWVVYKDGSIRPLVADNFETMLDEPESKFANGVGWLVDAETQVSIAALGGFMKQDFSGYHLVEEPF